MKMLILLLPTVLLLVFAVVFSHAAPKPVENQVQGIPLNRAELSRLSAVLDSMEGEVHHVVPRGGLSN